MTRMRPILTAAPAVQPVTLVEAKAWMWIEHSNDDTLIGSMVSAAIAHLDGYTGILGRCIVNQTWRQDYTEWSGDLRLPFPDVSSVTVKYFDSENNEQTVSSANYELIEDDGGALVRFVTNWTGPNLYDDRSDRVRVTLVAGFGAAEVNVPEPIKAAIKMLVAHWYANREAASGQAMAEVPLSVSAVIAPHRRMRV
jgi:uncharacterized phiE125 gp8 family phage protein